MKIVFFTFYYPPDLCAGSFRSVALAEQLQKLLPDDSELHVVTTMPNRYASHMVEADKLSKQDNLVVHRINIPRHNGGMLSQAKSYIVYAWHAYALTREIAPDFLIATSSRLVTAALAWMTAMKMHKRYYLDIRDIFSETISDVLARRSSWLGKLARHFFSWLEKPVLKNAAAVNVVSQGFPEYFEQLGIDTSEWQFFPNGVDQEFMAFHEDPLNRSSAGNRPLKVLYAGNIGNGQGLENILPEVARMTADTTEFRIVGDGGTRQLLLAAADKAKLANLHWQPPVNRSELLQHYSQADVLFLHLNDLPAFERVLPSKIFEYAALGKPILAGISGYAADFVKQNIPYACVFEPQDSCACLACLEDLMTMKVDADDVRHFTERFARTAIMRDMAGHIFQVIESGDVDK